MVATSCMLPLSLLLSACLSAASPAAVRSRAATPAIRHSPAAAALAARPRVSLLRGEATSLAKLPTAGKHAATGQQLSAMVPKARAGRVAMRAQETASGPPPVAFVAPPVALALAYALVKFTALDQALIGLIEAQGAPEMFRALDMPGWFYHWFHAANMAIAGGAMGGYGAWLGFETKAGRGDEPAWGALNGGTKRELHKQLMAGAALVFAAGGLGGVTFMMTMQKAVFESPHAVTGMMELLLFATQGAIAVAMGSNPQLRKAHSTLGSIILTLLTAHAALGIKLGLGL